MANLFVIAGHGNGDSGAVGGGYTEAERVRALASRLKALGGNYVTVGDTSRDWYADGGILTLDIPKDTQIIELHMDSASPSARGAHIIIKEGYLPDAYDNALGGFLTSILPGRTQAIVGRSDLANVNRAAERGYSYRLAEIGFITNAEDLAYFNGNGDTIAAGILKSFGIPVAEAAPKPQNITGASIQPNTGEAFQRMIFESVGQDSQMYRIKDKASGRYMTASNTSDGANVDFRAKTGKDDQVWKEVKKKKGHADYTLYSPAGDLKKYLSVENNGNKSNILKLWSALDNTKQYFWPREEKDGTILIIHTYTGKCVSAI